MPEEKEAWEKEIDKKLEEKSIKDQESNNSKPEKDILFGFGDNFYYHD